MSVNENFYKCKKLFEAKTLTPEEKVDLWHTGDRKVNIKACSPEKLNLYQKIAESKGYSEIVKSIKTQLFYLQNFDVDISTMTLTKYFGSDSDVFIPRGIKSLAKYAFSGCRSLKHITIPTSVEQIGEGAFKDCTNLLSIDIPDSVTEIGNEAFESCESLTTVTLPSRLLEIGIGTFFECEHLSSIKLPNTLTYIGESAFVGCASLTSIIIPDNVTTISQNAFKACTKLAYIGLPAKLTTLEVRAFSGCTNLGNTLLDIEIPASIKEIGWDVIEGCDHLKEVFYDGTLEDWQNIDGHDYLDEWININFPDGTVI